MTRGPRGEKRAIMSVWDDFIVSNKTWLNVEGTLNSWNRAKCSIASASGMTRGSTQLNGKLIGTRKRLACTRALRHDQPVRSHDRVPMAGKEEYGLPQRHPCPKGRYDTLSLFSKLHSPPSGGIAPFG